VRSGIYKRPVDGLVNVGRVNLHRDQQADLAVHGGVNKAVYAYPSEHHPYWKERFPKLELIWWSSGRRGRHPK
jgi:MOSC domain-containing protein YiiM